MCSFDLPRQQGLPRLPEEVDFRQAVLEGARQRYGELEGEVEDRIAHELAVIQEMGLADYFLVVADIVRFAKQQGIPVGPGRGSAQAAQWPIVWELPASIPLPTALCSSGS